MSLTIKNLKEVRGLLYPVRSKWYSIGIELEVAIEELDTIKKRYDDPGECLTDMLIVWLKSISPLPTWEALGDALKSGPINEKELGNQVSKSKEGDKVMRDHSC